MSQPTPATEKPSFYSRLGPLGPAALMALLMPPLLGIALLVKINTVSDWLKTHDSLGLAVYIIAFIVLAGFALLPTYAQAIVGGYAFGMTLGLPGALTGFLGASLIGYEIGRRTSQDRVDSMISENPRWRAVRNALLGTNGQHSFLRTLGTVILLRLPPNSPFALMNLFLSSVKVPRLAFAIGTLIGMAPRTALAVFLGAGIKSALTKDAIQDATPSWAIPVGIAITAVIVIIIGVIANRAIERMGRERPEEISKP